MRLILASSNKGKIKEIKAFFTDLDVFAYTDLMDAMQIEENGTSFKENAIIKAKAVAKYFPNDLVLADDSGLSVPIFDNCPGVISSRFAGDNASMHENRQKLIGMLKAAQLKTTGGFYTACIALSYKGFIRTTHGFMHGRIVEYEKGELGFGYDNMFVPKSSTKTLAQDDTIKRVRSHRIIALDLARILVRVLIK